MGSSSRDASRASRSRSAERSHRSDRSHRDSRDRDHERSRSRRRSRSFDRSSKRSAGHRSASRSRSLRRSVSPGHKEDDRSRSKRDRRTRSRSHSRSRETKKHRRRDRSSSVSSYSSESERSSSSSDSDSDSDSSSHRHRRKRASKHKKSKKSKKDSKKKKKKKHKKASSSGAVNQNAYGKYGILRESDFHNKSQSFQAWLRDIKKITEFNGPKWEAIEMFKEYMEDYNTATLPHEKYYDIEKYDMQQYQKQQRKRAKEISKCKSFVDEDALRRERHAQKLAREQEDFKLVLQTMDKDKIDAMRRQEQLRAQMQMHYKAGDVAEARRLEQLLRADEDAARR